MRRDSRLSGVLHVLLHLAEQTVPVTSDILARAMGTNPVVVRRIMAGLRERNYVRAGKGHGGGWELACDLETTTLGDIYNALGRPTLLAIGDRTEAPGCLVEQAVNAALGKATQEAEMLLLQRFGEITLGALSRDFHARMTSRPSHSERDASHVC